MDLDDLKAKWHEENEKNLQSNKKNMEQLQVLLKEKSSNKLIEVKKKYERIISIVLIGIFLNILISPFLHFLLGEDGPVFRLTREGMLSVMVIVISCLMVIAFYWVKYTSIETELSKENLETSLRESITRLKKSRRQEVGFIVGVFALVFTIGQWRFLGYFQERYFNCRICNDWLDDILYL